MNDRNDQVTQASKNEGAMRTSEWTTRVLALGLGCLALIGCGSGEPVGEVALSVGALSAADVDRVVVTIEGVGIDPPIVQELYRSADEWRAAIGGIPAGTDRTFTVRAYDADDVEILVGQATGVTILGDDTVSIAVLLQPSSGAPVLTENPPVVHSVIIAPGVLAPDQTAAVVVTASDVDPGDTLTYVWTASAGSFADPTSPSTTFTAPSSEGVVTLTITVTDPMGAGRVVTIDVPVSAANARGTARVTVTVNTWPIITRFAPLDGVVPFGGTTDTVIEVSDADGEPTTVTYAQDCVGGSVGTDGRFHAPLVPTSVGATPTGSMSAPHAFPNDQASAVLLSDGSVLVAGDTASGVAAERFDRATGLWSPAASLTTARFNHRMIQLLDGRALVVGGFEAGGCEAASAELYDPGSNTWSSHPGAYQAERAEVTRLNDGDVLVFGGLGCSGFLGEGARYDVGTDTWTSITPTSPRADHTLTTLIEGRVLVVGGTGSNSAEIYDPAVDAWFSVHPMVTPRQFHTATRLADGRVLVAGGDGFSGPLNEVEIYDPVLDDWIPTTPLAQGRYWHAATLLFDGRVLVSGGVGLDGVALDTAQIFDPSSGLWSSEITMSSPRYLHAAVALEDGRVLLAGGSLDLAGPNFATEVISTGGASAVCHITATASDPRGGTGLAIATVYVGDEITANHAPVIESTLASNWVAGMGDELFFSVTASDPDGDPLSYAWSATTGTFVVAPASGDLSARWVSDGRAATITVGISDGRLGAIDAVFEVEAGTPVGCLPVGVPSVLGLGVFPATANVANAGTVMLRADAYYSDAPRVPVDTTLGVTWSSSNPAVVSVGPDGLASYTGTPGTAVITASFGSEVARSHIRVWDSARLASLTSLSISGVPSNMSSGSCYPTTVTATFSGGETEDVTETAVFRVGSRARVLEGGLFVADGNAGEGYHELTTFLVDGGVASSGIVGIWGPLFQALCSDVRVPGDLWGIEISPPAPSAFVGEAISLTAAGVYEDGSVRDITAAVTWAGCAASLDVTSEGLAIARVAGALRAVASEGGVHDTVTISVAEPTALGDLLAVELTPSAANLPTGAAYRMVLLARYADAPGRWFDVSSSATWSSENGAIATTSGGRGTGGALGLTTIHVMASGGPSTSANVRVWAAGRLASITSIAISVPAFNMTGGDCQQLGLIATFDGNPSDTMDLFDSTLWSPRIQNRGTLSSTGVFVGGPSESYATIVASLGRGILPPVATEIGVWGSGGSCSLPH